MATRTLSQLRESARQRADMEDDGAFVTDSELTEYINESISDLFDVLTDGDGGQLFAKNAPVLTQVGDNSYELPSDFYKLLSVSLFDGGGYYPGIPADPRFYAELAEDPPTELEFKYYIRNDLTTGQWFLFTFPEVNVQNLAVVYTPEPPSLSSDTDTFDGINNWHEYVVVDAAIKMLQKEQKETTALEFTKQRLQKRIEDHVRDIDTGIPKQIREIDWLYENQFVFGVPRRRR